MKRVGQEAIVFDGNVSVLEWGEPVFSGQGWQGDAANGYYVWLFDNDVPGVNYENIKYKVYTAYDDTYLYVAATVDGWDWSKTDTKFNFMAASYNPNTIVERFEYNGDVYERIMAGQYVADVGGNSAGSFVNNAIGMDKTYVPVEGTDYLIRWNNGNRVGYEMRIPWSQITPGNMNIAAGREFAFSAAATLSDHDANDGNAGNQLNWERGALGGLGVNPYYVGNQAVKLVLTDNVIKLPDPVEKKDLKMLNFDTMCDDVPSFAEGYVRDTLVNLDQFKPTRQDYAFVGWYLDEALTQPVSEVFVDKEITLYARWAKGVDGRFDDVKKGDWYYGAVSFVYDQGIMKGTGSTTYGVDGTVTRGMMATIFWRMEGSPAPTRAAGFKDVASNAYYAKAVDWAVENGIFTGYTNSSFRPGEAINREQIAATMQRYAKYKGLDMPHTNDLEHFVDKAQISEWAVSGVQWAVGNGLMTGKAPKILDPKGVTTRAQLSVILHRFLVPDVRQKLIEDAASGVAEMNKFKIQKATGITLDGEVNAAEWGKPLMSGKGWRENALTGYIPWIYDNQVPGVNYDLVGVDMYVRYDENYLYIAATVDGWNWTMKDTKLRFNVAGYWPGTVVEQFDWQGARYERLFNGTFSVNLDDSSKNTFTNDAIGMDKTFNAVWGEDYMVKYYGNNRVGYEARIPWSQVTPGNMDISEGRTFVYSQALTLSDYKPDDNAPGCVYNWEKGAMEGLGHSGYFMGNKGVLLVLD